MCLQHLMSRKVTQHKQACIDSALHRQVVCAKRPAATKEASATAAHPQHMACSTKARQGLPLPAHTCRKIAAPQCCSTAAAAC